MDYEDDELSNDYNEAFEVERGSDEGKNDL